VYRKVYSTGETSRDDLYTNLYDLQKAIGSNQGKLISLVGQSRAQIASLAKTDIAYRHALEKLNPFVVTGNASLYIDHNFDGHLDANRFSDLYLQDRAAMLTWKMQFDSGAKDADDLLSGDKSYDADWDTRSIADDWKFTDMTRNLTLTIDGNGADTHNIVFGSDAADTITGDSKSDHFYGMAGNDTISGGAGDDHLEGGRGNDILKGGAGYDTYVWHTGDGNDQIIDEREADGKAHGIIKIVNGLGQNVVVGGAYVQQGTSEVWVKTLPDGSGSITLTHAGEWTLMLTDGSALTLGGFKDGDFGIGLIDGPEVLPDPEITGLTISGDLAAKWFVGYDSDNVPYHYHKREELGNIITEGPEPGREDYLYDSAGNDKLEGLAGNDFLDAFRGGDDIVDGGAGDDEGYGGAGKDLLLGGSGSDAMIGGADDDRLYADQEQEIQEAYLAGETGDGTGARGDLLSGDAGDDQLYGAAGNDILAGGAGADTIYAGAGDDTIEGDQGFLDTHSSWGVTRTVTQEGDSLYTRAYQNAWWYEPASAEQGDDTIYAGAGADWVFAQGGNDFVDAGIGDDVVFGEGGDDIILGQAGNDILNGDSISTPAELHGDDYLDGGEGNDKLSGGGGADILLGGVGDDEMSGDDSTTPVNLQGEDYLDGDDGNDRMWGGGGADILFGGAGDDVMSGDSTDTPVAVHGDDYLDGEEGNDTILGNGGADILLGGLGNDELYGDASDLPAEAHGDDYLDGGDGNDILVGSGGADTLIGGTGDDQLHGDASDTPFVVQGDDYLDGGDGNDYLVGYGGDDTLLGGADDDMLYGVEGNDSLDGGAGADQLQGGGGNDLLSGEEGDDTLFGQEGNDILNGGVGVDYLDGGSGDDTYIFATGDSPMVLSGWFLTVEWIDDRQGVNTLVLPSGYPLQLYYDDYGLTLQYGMDDYLYLVDGIMQASHYNVDTGAGAVSLRSLIAQQIDAPLFLEGSAAADVLQGGLNDDVLIGNDGDDLLDGGAGNDTLAGGMGNDQLYGGVGNNTYLFNRGDGQDTVVDAEGFDTVSFGAGILSTDILVDRVGDQLILQLKDTGDQLTIVGYYAGGVEDRRIEQLEFADGEIWDQARIQGMVPNHAPILATSLVDQSFIEGEALTYILPENAFSDPDTDDTLTYTATTVDGGTLPDWLSFNPITREFTGTPPVGSIGTVSVKVVATDPEGLFVSDLFNLEVRAQAPPLFGTSGDDTLTGTAGNDILQGMAGNDLLIGGDGNDTYIFNPGDGVDRIVDSGGTDTIQFGAGITPDSLSLGLGSLLVRVGDQGEAIHLEGFNPEDPFNSSSIEKFRFADGTVLGVAELLARGFDIQGSGGDDLLTGTAITDRIMGGDGADTLNGGAGNDSLGGGSGNDAYIYNRWDGSDTIIDAAGHDSLVLGDDLLLSDFVASIDYNTGELTLGVINQADRLRTADNGEEYNPDPATLEQKIIIKDFRSLAGRLESFVFSDGTSLTDMELYNHFFTSEGDDVIPGLEGDNQIFAKGGNDTIALGEGNHLVDAGAGDDTINSGTGNDNFIFSLGGGHDLIHDQGGLDALLIEGIPGDISLEDFWVERVGNDVIVELADGSTACIKDWALTENKVENICVDNKIVAIDDLLFLRARNYDLVLDEDIGINGTIVLGNAGDGVTFTVEQAADNGSFVVDNNGSWTYIPNGDYAGVDQILVKVTNAAGEETISTIDLTINQINDAPVVVNDSAFLIEDMVISASGNVLANDSGGNAGAPLAVADPATRLGSYGTLSLAADGSYDYSLDNAGSAVQSLGREAVVTEHFSYTVTDGVARVDSALDITLTGSNDAPILAVPLADRQVDFDKNFSFQLPTGSFVDPDQGDILDYSATLADGSPLPSWLSFDAATQAFSGQASNLASSVDVKVTATDKVAVTGGTEESLSISDVFRITGGHGNEGVGNGEDAPPTGHDDNYNDGPGTGPGSPGSRRDHDDHRSSEREGALSDDLDNDRAWGQPQREQPVYLNASHWNDAQAPETAKSGEQVDPSVMFGRWLTMDLAVSKALAEKKTLSWLDERLGADTTALGKASSGFLGSTTPFGADLFSLQAGHGQELKGFKGLGEGLRKVA
jgi:VCBS repeat-containing protein